MSDSDQFERNEATEVTEPKRRSTFRRVVEVVLFLMVLLLLGGNVMIYAPEFSGQVIGMLPERLQTLAGVTPVLNSTGSGCCGAKSPCGLSDDTSTASGSGCQESCCSEANALAQVGGCCQECADGKAVDLAASEVATSELEVVKLEVDTSLESENSAN